MPMIPLNIVGGAKFGRYPKISVENTYNMIVSDNALVPYAGYVQELDLGGNENRGIFNSIALGKLIFVVDDRIYTLSATAPDTTLSYEFVGNLDTDSGDVYITENNNKQISISDGKNIYVYNWGNGSIAKAYTGSSGDPLYFKPGYIDYMDSYTISPDTLSEQWALSNQNEALIYQMVDPDAGVSYTGNYQTKPDIMRATVVLNRTLFVMASTGSELWHDVGNILFPFQRDNSIAIDYGVLSVPTIAVGFNRLVWLANNAQSGPVIVVSYGGPPQEIATDGIDFFIGDLVNPEDSDAFLFQEDGHTFYQITFHGDNVTLTYDFDTQMFFTLTDQNMDHHIAKKGIYYNNNNYFMSYEGGKIYQFGTQYTTYDGLTIPRFRICRHIRESDSSRFRINRLIITMEAGDSDVTQEVHLSMSKDGGNSFGSTVINTMNPIGRHRNIMQFWQLGEANDVVFKIGFWAGDNREFIPIVDPNPPSNSTQQFIIIDAQVEITDL